MDDSGMLLKRLAELEERVSRLEQREDGLLYAEDREFMQVMYQKAKELVVREREVSVIRLQRKLLIDMERAERILRTLEAEGIVGPETGMGVRKLTQNSKIKTINHNRVVRR